MIAALGFSCAAAQGDVKTGKKVPNFNLRTTSGGRLAMAALRGKVAIIDFWASWCAPCKTELPELEQLGRDYAAKGVAVITISIDSQRHLAAEMAQKLGLTLPVGLDNEKHLADRFNVSSLPAAYLVDRAGIVRFIHEGYVGDEIGKMRKELEELLGQP